LLERELVERHGRGAGAGVVEQHVEPTEGFDGLVEQGFDRCGVAGVGRHREGTRAGVACGCDGLRQRVGAPAGEGDVVTRVQEGDRAGAADAAARAGDDGDFVHGEVSGVGIEPGGGSKQSAKVKYSEA
jgi:hypothetical protein